LRHSARRRPDGPDSTEFHTDRVWYCENDNFSAKSSRPVDDQPIATTFHLGRRINGKVSEGSWPRCCRISAHPRRDTAEDRRLCEAQRTHSRRGDRVPNRLGARHGESAIWGVCSNFAAALVRIGGADCGASAAAERPVRGRWAEGARGAPRQDRARNRARPSAIRRQLAQRPPARRKDARFVDVEGGCRPLSADDVSKFP
jgi:hypothetical protein